MKASQEYKSLKKKYLQGWQTWNNDSVLSYIHMPEGVGLKLCIKDYQNAKFLENALIGTCDAEGIVTPRAHSYDASYTELTIEWLQNILLIQTGTIGGDQLILITPLKQPLKPSSLIVEGLGLWNKGGYALKKGEHLCLVNGDITIPVYMTAKENGELFIPAASSYLSASLSEELGISTGTFRTINEIKEVLANNRIQWQENMAKYGEHMESYNAMQTCQAWDTIYNPQEDAPITTVSRIWNKQWGGYVLFCWDTYFGALMQSLDNKELAYCNVIEITRAITEQGFIPNYTCQNGFKSYDRSQPPVGTTIALIIYEKYREKWFLEEVFEAFLAWNQWFIDHRSTKSGLLAWGSDTYEPRYDHELEHFGVHDRLGAAYESGLDNSPMYDDIPFDEERNILLLEDVGLTGLYIKDCYSLARIAEILCEFEQQQMLLKRASEMEDRLEQLWNEEVGLYLNRREDTGEFTYRLSPFHFHALFSKKVGTERVNRILKEHFYNDQEFYGTYILPSIARNDPSFIKQTYWQGRIWAPMNYLVYLALGEYELEQERKDLAIKSEQLILKEWLEHGHVHENYDPENGEGCNNPRSDKFYHWGGLLAYIAIDFSRKERSKDRS